jgi:hypothetical protein
MTTLDREIDRLYQLPLSEFISERTVLAKHAGASAAAVRALQKPSVPAWTVNQLYWRRRQTYDKLVTASERLRRAHASKLSGKAADVDTAERAHAAALASALADARQLLEQAGEQATDSTVAAVTETLHMLPWTTLAGRLTRPLKRTGLEALSALTAAQPLKARPPADVLSMRAALEHRKESAADRASREAAEQRRKIRSLEKDLRAAEISAERAGAALSKVEQSTRTALEARLERVRATLEKARRDVERARKQSTEAVAERTRLEEALRARRSRD